MTEAGVWCESFSSHVMNHSLGKTSYEGSCACDIQLDSRLQGSFLTPSRLGQTWPCSARSTLCSLIVILCGCLTGARKSENTQKESILLKTKIKF